MTFRSFCSIFLIIQFMGMASVNAQEFTSEPQPNFNPDNAPFGTYSYEHEKLHEDDGNGNVVDQLRKLESLRLGRNISCCDNVGECRATKIWNENGQWYFDHGGTKCAFNAFVRHDIPLPEGITGVVCAPYVDPDLKSCPIVWCAARELPDDGMM